MGATQTDQEPVLGKWSFITVSILGIALISAVIWSLSHALNNSSPQGSVTPANKDAPVNAVLAQEEIARRQYEMAEQRTAPVSPAPVIAQSAAILTNQKNDTVILQKAKTKVNQEIVERMKQYVRDNPNRDTRDIQAQIKKRENNGVQTR